MELEFQTGEELDFDNAYDFPHPEIPGHWCEPALEVKSYCNFSEALREMDLFVASVVLVARGLDAVGREGLEEFLLCLQSEVGPVMHHAPVLRIAELDDGSRRSTLGGAVFIAMGSVAAAQRAVDFGGCTFDNGALIELSLLEADAAGASQRQVDASSALGLGAERAAQREASSALGAEHGAQRQVAVLGAEPEAQREGWGQRPPLRTKRCDAAEVLLELRALDPDSILMAGGLRDAGFEGLEELLYCLSLDVGQVRNHFTRTRDDGRSLVLDDVAFIAMASAAHAQLAVELEGYTLASGAFVELRRFEGDAWSKSLSSTSF